MRRALLLLLASTAWAGTGYYRGLTIDHTKCGSSDSSNFAILVYASDTTLKDTTHGGHVQSSTGADILFFADSGELTQYASEIDMYDNVNGILWAWVQVPTVSHASNTTFYIFYGQTPAPARATNPWDTNYRGVWHLPNGSTLTAADSTTNGNNATSISAAPTSGQIDGGVTFNGTTQVVGVPNSSSLNFTGSVTIEAWFYETSSSSYRCITSKGANFARSMSVFLTLSQLNQVYYNNVGSLTLSTSWSLNTWNHLVLTDSGSGGTINIYLNGTNVYTHSGNGVGAAGNTAQLNLGYAAADSNYPMSGNLDEVRISSIARGADWVTTEYNNQKTPGNIGSPGFLTWGAETVQVSTTKGGYAIVM